MPSTELARFTIFAPMNSLLMLFTALFTSTTIIHDVVPTKIINNGTYQIQTSALATDNEAVTDIRVKIHYELHTNWYAPVPDQIGDLTQDLPVEFSREEGYLELERQGHEQFKNVDLYHLGRVNDGEFQNCHKIRVVKQDHTWEAIAYYHPAIASTGWSHMELTLKNVPGLGDYTIFSNLRR